MKVNTYRQMWNEAARLLAIVVAYKPSEEQIRTFKDDARAWGKLYVSCFSGNDVTSYIHVFGCHVHQFLEEYKSIGKFGNWAAEGLHSEVKYPSCTSVLAPEAEAPMAQPSTH